MSKHPLIIIPISALIFALLFFSGQEISLAQEQTPSITSTPASETPITTPASPAILAPSGLQPKEQAQLEQQYRQIFRDKEMLLSPYISGAAAGVDIAETEIKEQLEQEKAYRYFGVARNLYQAGRLEEAIEILKFILYKNPDDEYVKYYLKKWQAEFESQETGWQETSKKDIALLKQRKIDELIQDGIAYYKQKEYDLALLKFADVLGLQPHNFTAQEYMNKLKDHYLKEVRADRIVQDWQAKPATEKQTLASEISLESFQPPTEFREIFNYYISHAKQFAEEANQEAAYKSCKIAFLVTPLPEEIKTRIVLEIQKIAAQAKYKETSIAQAAEKFLAQEEMDRQGLAGTGVIEKLLDNAELKSIVLKKRSVNLLDKAELGLRVENIIAQKKQEEIRSRSFTVGPGDVLQVSVRDHPELSGKVIVDLKGQVALPLVNDIVKVKDLTLDEVTAAATEALKRYVKEPNVNVRILEYKSKIFYVVDENGATPYPITRANVTLRDALFISDWGPNRALGRVLVIKSSKLHPIIKKVDAFDLVYRGNLINNLKIENGDVIYIPMTAAKKITTAITDTFEPIRAAKGAGDTIIDIEAQRDIFKAWRIP